MFLPGGEEGRTGDLAFALRSTLGQLVNCPELSAARETENVSSETATAVCRQKRQHRKCET